MTAPDLDPNRKDRHRRTRALLAGGLVLGLGVAGTLAAWSDDLWANGQFQAGQFNVQGSPSKTTTHTWGEHSTRDGAPLAFSAEVPTIISPAASYYAPFSLAIDSTKADFDGTVQLTEYLGTGDPVLLSRLTWSARVVADPTGCVDETGYLAGTPLVDSAQGPAAGTPQPVSPASTIVPLEKNLNTTLTTPKTVCFKVTVDPQDTNDDPSTNPYGTTAAGIVWHFTATSE